MKAILESIPEFLQIAVAIVVALLLISLIFYFSNIFSQERTSSLTGDKEFVAEKIAGFIKTCWRDNREGFSSKSSVCKIINMTSDEIVTERDVTNYLDCEIIPNNKCEPDDCSSCTSNKYSNQDKVEWYVVRAQTKIKISYDGSNRIIKVSELL